jgi:hypothetical protein
MMPAVTTGANALPKKWLADGTAVTTTARQLLGALGVALATAILTQIGGIAGFRATFLTFAVIGVIGILLGLRLRQHQ